MKFELNEYHRNVSDMDLITDLKKVAKELSKEAITKDEYSKQGKYSGRTLVRRFGSWFKALEKAELKKTINRNIPKEELFHNLEEVWVRLGRQPKLEEMQLEISRFSSTTYKRRFGTWRRALEDFVKYVNDEQNVSFETIEDEKIKSTTKHKTGRTINWRLRFKVMQRDNFKCKACGRSPATNGDIILHVDHIKAWANGGETVLENLQTLCSVCNVGKSNEIF